MKPRMCDFATNIAFTIATAVEVCPTGAIRRMPVTAERDTEGITKDTTRIAVARFVCRCLVAREDMDCGACTEHCPTKALTRCPISGVTADAPVTSWILPVHHGRTRACPVTAERPEERERRTPMICARKNASSEGGGKCPRALVVRAVNQQKAVKKV